MNERLPSGDAVVEPSFGHERATDPPGIGSYASFAVYGEEGAALNPHWLDSYTAWESATTVADAATALPRHMRRGELTLMLAGAGRPVVSFDLSSGEVTRNAPTWDRPPEIGGQLHDLVELLDGTALASRQRTGDGRGGDLVLLDLGRGKVLRSFDLSGLSTGSVWPVELAMLGAEMAVVGLELPGEPDAGAVATVHVRTGEVRRLDLPTFQRCTSVVRLTSAASAAGPDQAAVLCTGDLRVSTIERRGAGLAWLVGDAGAVTVGATRSSGELFEHRPPTGPWTGLAGTWVAVLSRGDPDVGRPDALFVADVSSEAAVLLYEERWTDRFGEGLGSGGFSPGTMELRWPSVSAGLLRWRMTSAGADARFDALPAVPAPGCSNAPARVVRALEHAGAP